MKIAKFIALGVFIFLSVLQLILADTLPVQGVITVKKDGTADFRRIEEALCFSRPGDIIEIQDSQTYPENLNLLVYPDITIRAKEQENPVIYGYIYLGNGSTLEGLKITYPAFVSSPTIWVFGSTSGWTVKDCEVYDIPFNSCAFYLASGAFNGKIINNRVHGGQGDALYNTVNYDKGNILIANNIFYNIGTFRIASSSVNNQVVSNTFYQTAVAIDSASTIFKNNLVVSASFQSAGTVSYNCFSNSANRTDNGNLVVDPLLANPESGDFHLQSQSGRWNGANWVVDLLHSPLIDAGDPSADFSNEPNGSRIEMGGYGNTSFASRSLGSVNAAPPAPQISISPVNPAVTGSLTCNITGQTPDPNGDSLTYTYHWFKNSRLQDGLTSNTVSSSSLETGDLWRCAVTANDGALNSIPAITEARVQGDAARADYAGLKTKYSWIQTLIDGLPAEGGVVQIPDGEHVVAVTFIDRNDVVLQGSGLANTALKPYKASGNILNIGNNLQKVEKNSFKDFAIIGGATINRNIQAMKLFNNLQTSIENVLIKNCCGIYNEQGDSVNISKSEFYNLDKPVFTGSSKGTKVTDCKFYDSGYWWTIDFQNEQNGVISPIANFTTAGAGRLSFIPGQII